MNDTIQKYFQDNKIQVSVNDVDVEFLLGEELVNVLGVSIHRVTSTGLDELEKIDFGEMKYRRKLLLYRPWFYTEPKTATFNNLERRMVLTRCEDFSIYSLDGFDYHLPNYYESFFLFTDVGERIYKMLGPCIGYREPMSSDIIFLFKDYTIAFYWNELRHPYNVKAMDALNDIEKFF